MTKPAPFLPDVGFQRESLHHLKVSVALSGYLSKNPNQTKKGHLQVTMRAAKTANTETTCYFLCRRKTKTLEIRFVGFGPTVTNTYTLRDWPTKPAKKTPAKK